MSNLMQQAMDAAKFGQVKRTTDHAAQLRAAIVSPLDAGAPSWVKPDPYTNMTTPAEMLFRRLTFAGRRGDRVQFDETGRTGFKICAVEELPDEVIVFGINAGKPVTLTDSLDLFPSDTLISKIRLLTA